MLSLLSVTQELMLCADWQSCQQWAVGDAVGAADRGGKNWGWCDGFLCFLEKGGPEVKGSGEGGDTIERFFLVPLMVAYWS